MHGTDHRGTGYPTITAARDGYARDGRTAAARHHLQGFIEVPSILKDTDPYRFVAPGLGNRRCGFGMNGILALRGTRK